MPREMMFDRQDRFDSRYAWIDIPSSLDSATCVVIRAAGSPRSTPSSPRVVLTPRVSYSAVPDLGNFDQGTNILLSPTPSPRQTRRSSPNSPRGPSCLTPAAGGAQILPDPALEVSRLVGVSRRNRETNFGSLSGASVPRRFAVFVRHHNDGLAYEEVTGTNVLYAASMALVLVDLSSQTRR